MWGTSEPLFRDVLEWVRVAIDMWLNGEAPSRASMWGSSHFWPFAESSTKNAPSHLHAPHPVRLTSSPLGSQVLPFGFEAPLLVAGHCVSVILSPSFPSWLWFKTSEGRGLERVRGSTSPRLLCLIIPQKTQEPQLGALPLGQAGVRYFLT